MHKKTKPISSLEHSTFQRFSRLYLLALSIIALSILGSQVLVQEHLGRQLSDARIVNIAGRQRMLSQRLTKELLLLNDQSLGSDRVRIIKSLESNFRQWQTAHQALQNGDPKRNLPKAESTEVNAMFKVLNPTFSSIEAEIQHLLLLLKDKPALAGEQISTCVRKVLKEEPLYLLRMDGIVDQLSKEATKKVESLRKTEWILLIIGLGIIAAEIFLLFRPAAQRIRMTIRELVASREKASELANRAEQMYKEKEQSLQELRTLNYVIDQAVLFASAGIDGRVIHLSHKFRELLALHPQEVVGQLAELMSIKEGEQEYLKALIKRNRSALWSGEVRVTDRKQKEHWLELSILPVNRSGVPEDLLLLAADITTRKIAQQEIDRLKEAQFQESMLQQKLRSSYVVEAQEEERKRIARDMHDGIGQMLTALKFNLQAINLSKPEKAKKQLENLNELVAVVIRGFRVATFNLTPPELSDYGIGAALSKLASELSKLTGHPIYYENRNGFHLRLDSIIETNLYRITQEAVNNAIKYAQAKYILISLAFSRELLSITIDDDGVGFSPDELSKHTSVDGTGMGLAFMKERSHFINGRLFIHSTPGNGTRVTLNMPLQPADLISSEKSL